MLADKLNNRSDIILSLKRIGFNEHSIEVYLISRGLSKSTYIEGPPSILIYKDSPQFLHIREGEKWVSLHIETAILLCKALHADSEIIEWLEKHIS